MTVDRRSVRSRITLVAAAVTAVVLVATAVAVVLVVQWTVRRNLDQSLVQRADQVASIAAADPERAVTGSDRDDRFAQVLDERGEVIAASANVGAVAVVAPPEDGAPAFSTRSDLPFEDDTFRVLVRPLDTASGVRWVVVGESDENAGDAVRALVVTLTVIVPGALALLTLAIWWLTSRTLRPVEDIRRQVETIGLTALDQRVPAPGTGDEVDRLATTMNDMLTRLERSAERQRQFVADVSHELRTPLTRLRTALEVDLADPGSDYEATSRSALRDAVEMQDLVDDLLFLARQDAARDLVRRDPIDLDVVVGDEVRAARQVAVAPAIDMSGVGAAVVDGDRSQLARMVRNLLSNAIRYAAEQVTVTLTEDDSWALLQVIDDGPGIPTADRERVFGRFVRLDAARSSAEGGSGLGLAIVADVVAAHGGTVSIDESPAGGASVSVRLPLVRPTDGGAPGLSTA